MNELFTVARTFDASVWQAFINSDAESLSDHVYEDAIIFRNGKKTDGVDFISQAVKSDIDDCETSDYEVVYATEKTIQSHYRIKLVSCCGCDEHNGESEVTTTWHYDGENWGLIYCMMSSVITKINLTEPEK